MLTETRHRSYTLEEYRQLEKTAEFRSEYRDGEIVPMTGGTINHNRITGNIYAFLKYALRGKNAEAFMNDLRLWIPRYRRGTYPDVMVFSGQPVFSEGRKDEILNPVLIVEVLSNSTEDFDRENKFRFYRSIFIRLWNLRRRRRKNINRLPITNYQLPITNYQLPITRNENIL